MKGELWQTIYPIHGIWFHIRNVIQVGEIYLKLTELYPSANIEAISICSDDMRKHVLNSRDKITRFHSYLLHHCGIDDLRIRVRIKNR